MKLSGHMLDSFWKTNKKILAHYASKIKEYFFFFFSFFFS